MTFSLSVVLLLSILSLSARSTISKNECMTKEWQQAGYRNGSQERFQNKLASESKVCAKYNLAVVTTFTPNVGNQACDNIASLTARCRSG